MSGTTQEEPFVLLYTARSLPIFHEWLFKQHPFPERYLDRPCWLFGSERGDFDDDLFDRLPEGPVDDAHHEHFDAMMDDVHTVMTRNAAFRRRLLGHEGHGMVGLGYHTTASLADVRRYFERRVRVLDAEELVRVRRARPQVDADVTLKRAASLLGIGPRSLAERLAVYDYLQGGGALPPALKRPAPKFVELFRDVSPLDFNEVHLRALDLFARAPDELARVEAAIDWSEPVFDTHYRWRELVLARGLDESRLESLAVRAWVDGHGIDTRAWWVLARAAEDLDGFLARHLSAAREERFQRRLLSAVGDVWDLPRTRALATELLAKHGSRLSVAALTSLLGVEAARLVDAHREAVCAGRSAQEVDAIGAWLSRVLVSAKNEVS